MRRKFTVYGLRFSKTSFWNRINTGFPDHAVATVLTACSIETNNSSTGLILFMKKLQQFLPLAVLKHIVRRQVPAHIVVATVLTACSIETIWEAPLTSGFPQVATVLTACSIETDSNDRLLAFVADGCNSSYRLQY